jgi:UrcA family protein
VRKTFTALFAGAVLLPAVAFASDSGREVRYADLDLRTETGRAMLDARIDSAASALCREIQPSVGLPVLAPTRCINLVRAATAEQRDTAIARAGTDRPVLAVNLPRK